MKSGVKPESYTLTLEPLPNDGLRRTPLMRLKALLKAAKRAYGLRATVLKPDITTSTEEPL